MMKMFKDETYINLHLQTLRKISNTGCIRNRSLPDVIRVLMMVSSETEESSECGLNKKKSK